MLLTTRFTLPAPPDFHFLSTVNSHGWCVLAPFSYDERGTLTRVQKLRSGRIVRFDARDGNPGLTVISDTALTKSQQREVGAVIARCFSFDHDLSPFHDLIHEHPTYAWIEAVGAGRMLVSPSVWEDLAKTLLTTNTTWAMTKGMVSRLATLGEGLDDAYAFPEPERIAALDPDALNQHVRAGYRGAYLHELATDIAAGTLDVEAWRDPALPSGEVYRALKQIKGFGDYAAGAMMRLLGRFDQLGLDSVCRAMYAQRYNGGQPATDREIAAYYEPFGAWRGLVVWLDVMRAYILT
jgi:3-methyladenine DNA glycosylase/8-oxoguanine DNA glycosylase